MKIKNIFKNIALAAAVSVSVSSCSDWLKVDMEDGIMESALFEDNEGFLIALNGVYTNLNTVYSSFFGMGAIDVMAQYYNVQKNSTHPYYIYANYDYDDSSFDSASGSLWTNMYTLIANVNVLLEHCDEEGSAISARYYPMVKGEALALRAMMHFDMLRFYGPIYSDQTSSQEAIPYLEKANNRDMLPILSAKEVADKVINDLKEASSLLENDSIRTYGVSASESTGSNKNNDFRYRQYRLNYYAVQGLLARAYMWIGDKSEAYNVATALIKEVTEKNVFPWVSSYAATSLSTPDRIFSSEVMFGLYNTSRLNQFNSLFNSSLEGDALSFTGGLSGTNSKIEAFYGEGSTTDYRRKMWEVVTTEGGDSSEEGSDEDDNKSQSASYLLKYEDIELGDNYRYMIPLMRISEFYLMIAECTSDLTEATEAINEIRVHRSVADVAPTAESVKDYITKEFAREVIGEGQLFFYYKRNAMEKMISGTSVTESFNMELSDYVVPLPTAETNNRQ